MVRRRTIRRAYRKRRKAEGRRECTPEQAKANYERNRETILARLRVKRDTDPAFRASQAAARRAYYVKYSERLKAEKRAWYKDNRAAAAEYRKRRHRELKTAAIMAYSGGSGACMCCGETELAFLTLDHVNGDGAIHRSRLASGKRHNGESSGYNFYRTLHRAGYPQDPPIQVLCFNCNCGRSINGGTCPHAQRERRSA